MTSNGNTAQKHLIQVLTITHQAPKDAYNQAVNTAPNKATAEIIKRIYKKLILEYNTQEAEKWKGIFDIGTPEEAEKIFNKKIVKN